MVSLAFTLGAFILVVLIVNKTGATWIAMLVGSLAAALGSGLTPEAALNIVYKVLTTYSSLSLIAIVVLIKSLGHIMGKAGLIDRMIDSLKTIIRNPRLLTAIIPALLGLLPIPGGAYMSAPLVDKTGSYFSLPLENKTAANLLYRHLVYFIFPLYHALILIQSITTISLYKIIGFCFVPVIVSGTVGYWYIMPHKYMTDSEQSQKQWEAGDNRLWQEFFVSSSPILLLVGLAVITHDFLWATLIAIAVTIVLAAHGDMNIFKRTVLEDFLKPLDWKLGLTILGILLFQRYVESGGALLLIADFLTGLGIPLLVLLMVTSFIIGALMGSTLGAMAVVLAIFFPIIPGGQQAVVYVSIAYLTAMVGYNLSPIHLCLILTQEYFCGDLKRAYPLLIVPFMTLIITGLIIGWWMGF